MRFGLVAHGGFAASCQPSAFRIRHLGRGRAHAFDLHGAMSEPVAQAVPAWCPGQFLITSRNPWGQPFQAVDPRSCGSGRLKAIRRGARGELFAQAVLDVAPRGRRQERTTVPGGSISGGRNLSIGTDVRLLSSVVLCSRRSARLPRVLAASVDGSVRRGTQGPCGHPLRRQHRLTRISTHGFYCGVLRSGRTGNGNRTGRASSGLACTLSRLIGRRLVRH